MEAKLIRPSYIRCRPGEPCDILFFGESPGEEEIVEGQAFVGPAGKLLRQLLEFHFPDKRIVLDNTVPEDLHGEKPKKADIIRYADYRMKSLTRHKPRIVVLLGEYAFRGWGLDYKPTRDCGRIIPQPQCPFILSVHPAYVLRSKMTELHRLRQVMKVLEEQLAGSPQRRFTCINQPKKLIQWLKKNAQRTCSFDIETSQLNPVGGLVLSASICNGRSTIWVPLFHPQHDANATVKVALVMLIEEWWGQGPRIVHNAMMELSWMRYRITKDPPKLYDTLLQQWLLDENNPKGLDYLVTSVLCEPPYWTRVDYNKPFAEQPLEEVGLLNAHDAEKTFQLHRIQRGRMTREWKTLHDCILAPLVGVLVNMRSRGFKLNRAKLKALRTQIRKRITTLEGQTRKVFGMPDLNFRSPKQLEALLFDQLGLPSQGQTDGGARSTDEAAIAKLALIDPRVKPIHEIKALNTLLSGALTKWDEVADEKGYLRTDYNLGHVVTGRLSSSNPNMQNIDRRDKEVPWRGCQRDALVSRFPGGKLVQLDYAQHEYRIMMAVVGQEDVLQVLAKGMDPHQATADRLRIPRPIAKSCNFALIYGGSAYTLYEKYSVPLSEGSSAVEAWYKGHPKVQEYHRWIETQIRHHGFVESIFGWRRRVGKEAGQHEINQAVNFPGQNPAVLVCYMAMIDIESWLTTTKRRSILIHQIHDSIVLDVPREELKTIPPRAAEIMVDQGRKLKGFCGNRLKGTIPLAVDIKVGDHL